MYFDSSEGFANINILDRFHFFLKRGLIHLYIQYTLVYFHFHRELPTAKARWLPRASLGTFRGLSA